MNKRFIFLIFVISYAVFVSCNSNSRDVSLKNTKTISSVVHVESIINPEINSQNSESNAMDLFDKDLSSANFFARYVLGVSDASNPEAALIANTFLSDSIVQKAYAAVDSVFSNKKMDKEMESAFHYFNYHFPKHPLPKIYTVVSGFNNNLFYNSEEIGISLDRYLGADCDFYPLLGIPSYKYTKMTPSQIPLDVVDLWLRIQFPLSIKKRQLVDHLIYEGKIIYAMSYCFPDLPLYRMIGYSEDQWRWCLKSESGMWNYVVDQKLLFDTSRLLIQKMVRPAPFTNFFTPKSPGQCGRWIGLRIIQSYMKRNPKCTLQELLQENNASKILNQSGYAPL